MSQEAVTNGFHEAVGSKAFNLEYDPSVRNERLRDDIVSYLGEYRLRVKKYNYNLVFSNTNSEGQFLRDSHEGEPMFIKAYRTLEERKSRWEPTHREEAELKGLRSLDRQLMLTKDSGTVLWASPMGPEEEGYGKYGFIFFGKVAKKGDKKNLSMTAIRLENPSITSFNKALSDLTGQEVGFKTAEDFLASPFVIDKNIDEGTLDEVLMKNFNFSASKDEKSMFKKIMQRMDGMINDFIDMVKMGVKEGRLKAFHALENYSLKLKKEYEVFPWENIIYDRNQRLGDILGNYGHKPPAAAGSCGSTEQSSNIFSKWSSLNSIFENQEWFHCPECGHQADGPIGNTCPGCGLTKEAYAEETGISCD